MHYGDFVQNYDRVRHGEKWGGSDGDYYRALPYRDLSGRHVDVWRVRSISFQALLKEVVQPLSQARNRALRILDCGAGNGWMSYRLALEGHDLLATDLRVDDADGLGACSWYMDAVTFEMAQATFEELPLCDGQVDLVIFGGSIHYSANYEETLTEALRVLRHDGQLVILDSPVYKHAHSGGQMVKELYKQLQQNHSIDPHVAIHENYLTPRRLQDLGRQLSLSWRQLEPHYGWRWALAPWLARLRRRREPARFYVIVGQRQS